MQASSFSVALTRRQMPAPQELRVFTRGRKAESTKPWAALRVNSSGSERVLQGRPSMGEDTCLRPLAWVALSGLDFQARAPQTQAAGLGSAGPALRALRVCETQIWNHPAWILPARGLQDWGYPLYYGLSFPRRACPREGVGRESMSFTRTPETFAY